MAHRACTLDDFAGTLGWRVGGGQNNSNVVVCAQGHKDTSSACSDALDSDETSAAVRVWVLFHKTYQVTLVVETSQEAVSDVTDFCVDFPDFQVVNSFAKSGIPSDQLILFFHRKSFMSFEAAQAKLDSLVTLLDITNVQAGIASTSAAAAAAAAGGGGRQHHAGEKQRVLGYIARRFVISNDATQRMRACDLYDELEESLHVSAHGGGVGGDALRKRISGYLLELGLAKKRYSDGYYYYGIRSKFDTRGGSLAQVEDVRRSEIPQRPMMTPSELQPLRVRDPDAAAAAASPRSST
jgi:hypothetical protein